MNIEFSNHALARMRSRGISKKITTIIINHPDFIEKQDDSITIYSKLVEENSKPYLYRVFINKLKNPPLIITAYKTSKIEKYGSKIR